MVIGSNQTGGTGGDASVMGNQKGSRGHLDAAAKPFHIQQPASKSMDTATSSLHSSQQAMLEQDVYNIVIPSQTAKRIGGFEQTPGPSKCSMDFLATSPTKASCTLVRTNSAPGSFGNLSKISQVDPGPQNSLVVRQVEVPVPLDKGNESSTVKKRGRPTGSNRGKKKKGAKVFPTVSAP